MAHVITASRLRDGIVVFRGASAVWVDYLRLAEVLPTLAEAEGALSAAKQDEGRNIVVDCYVIEVVEKNGVMAPVKLREAIRAEGPTIYPEHGKSSIALSTDGSSASDRG
ncbi:DUF2849 domain-containing protein [Lichenihabitans psoromatis]|uniref:DUF2849 domain-containing protein n=1 Tax=Lichenihabitans psoromatis TaxID=2528642 RepID=UPI0013F1622C|nr:DUF2849 domain-containing protein [Lichenihabitans psoromatis]